MTPRALGYGRQVVRPRKRRERGAKFEFTRFSWRRWSSATDPSRMSGHTRRFKLTDPQEGG